MKLTKIAGVALAVLLIAGGTAAALPGNAPTDAPTQNETADAPRGFEGDVPQATMNDTDTSTSDDRRGPPADAGPAHRGPPTDMPANVPDFVTDLHETINAFLSGDLQGSLGEAIADLTPADDDQQADAQEQSDGDQSEQSTGTPEDSETTTSEQDSDETSTSEDSEATTSEDDSNETATDA